MLPFCIVMLCVSESMEVIAVSALLADGLFSSHPRCVFFCFASCLLGLSNIVLLISLIARHCLYWSYPDVLTSDPVDAVHQRPLKATLYS